LFTGATPNTKINPNIPERKSTGRKMINEDIEQFESILNRFNKLVRKSSEKKKGEQRVDGFVSQIMSEIADIKDEVVDLKQDIGNIPVVDVSSVSMDVKRIMGEIPDNTDKILDFIKTIPDKIVEVEKIVEVDKFIPVTEIVEIDKVVPIDKIVEVDKIVTVAAEKVKKWNFEVVRENGLISNVIGTAGEE
jgi:hypothetical protein